MARTVTITAEFEGAKAIYEYLVAEDAGWNEIGKYLTAAPKRPSPFVLCNVDYEGKGVIEVTSPETLAARKEQGWKGILQTAPDDFFKSP